MQISYLQSIQPIVLATKVSKNRRNSFDVLFENTEFQNARGSLLSYFPELKLFDISNHIGENFFELPVFSNQDLVNTLKQLGLNLHLKEIKSDDDNVIFAQFFGFCLDLDNEVKLSSPLFQFVFGKEKIIETASKYISNKLSAIFIPLRTSKQELHTWVDENWDKIQEKNIELPKHKANFIPKNLLMGKEITDLRDTGLTFNEISELLSEKYPDDTRLMSYNDVKSIYHKYRDYITDGFIDSIAVTSLKRTSK